MSNVSDAKLAANRANAAHSTGPRTPAGKEASKHNGLLHGLSSPLAVLPFEDQNEYNELAASFSEEYAPEGPTEEALLKLMVDSQWKLRRLEKLEQHVFALTIEQDAGAHDDPFAAMAATLLAPGKGQNALALLARYQGTLNRQFLQALKQLKKIQFERGEDYCDRLKREALHQISGNTDRTQTEKLAFNLIADDPGCITRYIDAQVEIVAAQCKRDRAA